MSILSVLILITWEFSLFYVSFLIANLEIRKRSISTSLTSIGAVLGIKLLLGALIPQWIVFFGPISTQKILGTSILVILLVTVFARKYEDFYELCLNYYGSIITTMNRKILLLTCSLVLIAPAIGSAIGVIVEADSIINSDSLISVMKGTLTPLDYPWNYSMFWESGYLPSIHLLNSTIFIGILNLQCLMFLLIGIKSLLNELSISKINARLLLVATSLSGLVWGYSPNGISTLKNDLILGSSTIWLIVIFLRYIQSRPITYWHQSIMLVSSCFILCKFSGLVILGLFLGLTISLKGRKIFLFKIRNLIILTLSLVLTNGLYYFSNIIEHGNPISPFSFKAGFLSLPGEVDTSGTRVIDHINELKTYEYFFQLNNLVNSRVGTFFAVNFGICLLYVLFSFLKKKMSKKTLDVYLSLLFVGLWLIFLITPWSAGITSEPFFYLQHGYSFRYAIASVMLTVILSTYAIESVSATSFKFAIPLNILVVIMSLEYLYATPWVGIARYIDLEMVTLSVFLIGILPSTLIYLSKNVPKLGFIWIVYLIVLIPGIKYFEDSSSSKFGWELNALEDFPSSSAQVFLGNWDSRIAKLDGLLMPNAFPVVSEVGVERYGGLYNFTPETSQINSLVEESGVLFTSYPSSIFSERDFQVITSYMSKAGYNLVSYRPNSIAFFRKFSNRQCDPRKEWCHLPEYKK